MSAMWSQQPLSSVSTMSVSTKSSMLIAAESSSPGVMIIVSSCGIALMTWSKTPSSRIKATLSRRCLRVMGP